MHFLRKLLAWAREVQGGGWLWHYDEEAAALLGSE